jgi:hypothetical protein
LPTCLHHGRLDATFQGRVSDDGRSHTGSRRLRRPVEAVRGAQRECRRRGAGQQTGSARGTTQASRRGGQDRLARTRSASFDAACPAAFSQKAPVPRSGDPLGQIRKTAVRADFHGPVPKNAVPAGVDCCNAWQTGACSGPRSARLARRPPGVRRGALSTIRSSEAPKAGRGCLPGLLPTRSGRFPPRFRSRRRCGRPPLGAGRPWRRDRGRGN